MMFTEYRECQTMHKKKEKKKKNLNHYNSININMAGVAMNDSSQYFCSQIHRGFGSFCRQKSNIILFLLKLKFNFNNILFFSLIFAKSKMY